MMAGGLLVGLVVSFGALPDGLSLQFKARYEPRLDHLVALAMKATPNNCISGTQFPAVPVFGKVWRVCTYGGQVEFDGQGRYGEDAYLYSKGVVSASDSCVLHLEGPWWEENSGEDGVSCPWGFTSVPGA